MANFAEERHSYFQEGMSVSLRLSTQAVRHPSADLFRASLNSSLCKDLDQQTAADRNTINWYSLPLSNHCHGHNSHTSIAVSNAKAVVAQTARLAQFVNCTAGHFNNNTCFKSVVLF
jgi:hypothetical protein